MSIDAGSLSPGSLFRAAETRDHPTLVRIKKVPISRANMDLRCGKRSAAQDFLPDKPLVIVLIEIRFKSRIRRVVRSRPLPNIANHLMTPKRSLTGGKRADRRH